ncbi:MAG: tetratricopeptide repeat protein [Myxococcota bacterium]
MAPLHPTRLATRLLFAGLLLSRSGLPQPVAEPPAPTPLVTSDVADAQKRPRTLAILPFKDHLVTPSDLFAPQGQVSRDNYAASLESVVLRSLEATPYVTVKPPARVREELSDDSALQAVGRAAQARYRLGLDLYLGMAAARAQENLKESAEMYRSIFQDVSDPKPYADAQFMLGVSLVDLGRVAEGHIALKDAFQIQADRRFRPNFFPPQVNTALANALVDHLSTADPLHPYGDNRRMHDLATRLGVSALVTGTVRGSPDGPVLHLAIFGVQRRIIEAEIRVSALDSSNRIDAFLSRWLACAPIGQAVASSRSSGKWRMDTSGSYALYARQPTRQDFHSVGFAAGVSYDLRPGFEWFGRVNMYTSLSDPYRDLLHSFNSVRVLGGVGFTLRRGPLRLFVRPGIDLHVLGSFVASTDADCKFLGLDHPLCDASTVSNLDQDLLAGLNLALGGQVHIGRDFFLSLQGSASSYFLPFSGTDRLNYPLSAEIGLGYRL